MIDEANGVGPAIIALSRSSSPARSYAVSPNTSAAFQINLAG